MDYPGWTVETTHPTDPNGPDYCATCADNIAPTIAFAEDWGSSAHGNQITDENGVDHVIQVRRVVEETEG
jgi:hypothetical protein